MDISPGLHDRLGSFSKGDALPKREELPHTADGYDTQGVLLVQRCLIVRRDEKGYGLTVSGDNPVFVQSVKPGGAAARAGVHQGDRIIKVNGTLVTQSNHQDVVHLIKSGAHVALTLLGPPSSGGGGVGERPNDNTGGVTTSTAPAASPPSHQPLASKQSSERITGPQPVDPEKQQQCTNISYLTIKKMLEKEQAYLMQLLQDYGKTSSEKSHAEMQSARKRISHLENQLLALRGSNSGQEATGASSRPRPGIEARRSTEGPEGLRSSSFHVAPHPTTTGRPRSGPLASSASLENLSHALGPSPWSVPTHLRQRSSPETLLCTLEGTLGPVEEPPMGPSLDLGLVPSSCTDNPPVTPVRDPGDLMEAWHGDDTTEEADNTSEEGFLEGELPGLDDSLEGRPLQYGTPPEGPPTGGRVPLQQSSILSMDDEERTSDNELTQLGDNGPFNNIWKLLRHPAHLAVFLHYLLSSQMKPSSLLFLIITNLYKLGTGKEMKKWAYEITSTFLVQNAPLGIENIDETILKEIDKVLQTSQEQQGQEEEELKDIFLKAREKAMEQLKRLLVDFRNTRTIGLSGLYMPNDVTLDDSLRDKNAELHIVESLLLTELETLGKEDPENLSDYKSALASALATVLKSFGVKTPNAVTLIERFPTFVAREKSRLKFFPRNKKFAFQTIHTRGHHFQSQQYHCVTYCNHCQHIIWGVGDQGYQCTNCEMNIHKTCVRVVEEQCIGSLRHKKAKKNHRMSGLNLMEGIKTKARRPNARRGTQHSVEDWTGSLDPAVLPLDPDRNRPETGDECEAAVVGGAAELLDKGASRKNSATAVGRSESFRQRRETRPSYRKRSDPNIPRSKSDVDVDDKPTNLNNSGSSSNSSLSTSRSLESPSQSWEAVHRGEVPPLGPLDDSDLEWDLEPPDWQAALGREALRQLKPKEKKRQDVLNELFHTERSHVRTLKVLERIFRRPLQQQELLAPELLQRLFPNLDELLRIHQGFSTLMKRRRAQEPLIGDIGPMMLAMLDGESGERLQQAVATFCQHQSLALEALKARQKKDQKLAQFLVDAEMHPLCRRLQLKDLVAAGFQRLTKYPLLIENVAKHSALGSTEHAQLQRALQCSKRILAHVNQAVREAENTHRLAELQRRLDKSALDKVENHPLSPVYRHLDLKRHRLVHEGALTMRLPRQKPLDVQLVLLEDLLLVLQRQDGSERLALRFYSVSLPTATAEDRMLQCPVMRLRHLHARDVATDPRAFFLLDTEPEQRAMWEFAAASAVEKRGWLEHIVAATRAHVPPGDDESKHAPETPSDDTPTVLDTGATGHEDEEEEVPTDKEEGGSKEEEETTPPASVAEQSERGDKEEPAKEEGPDKEQGVLAGAPVATPSVAQGGLSLVDFQEVVVVPSAPCETATPVLTPIERLRRQDQQVLSALAEKQALLAEILRIPSEDYVHMAEISEEMNAEKGLMELLLQVTYHANQLPVLINEAMNVTEEDAVAAASSPEGAARRPGVCPHRLLSSVQPLLRYLSLLAPSLAELEQERQRLRLELSRLQDARQPVPCTEEEDGGVIAVANDDMAAECCREAAVQTLEEAVCHCPTTDLDAEDELPHDEPQPAQAQPVYF